MNASRVAVELLARLRPGHRAGEYERDAHINASTGWSKWVIRLRMLSSHFVVRCHAVVMAEERRDRFILTWQHLTVTREALKKRVDTGPEIQLTSVQCWNFEEPQVASIERHVIRHVTII